MSVVIMMLIIFTDLSVVIQELEQISLTEVHIHVQRRDSHEACTGQLSVSIEKQSRAILMLVLLNRGL